MIAVALALAVAVGLPSTTTATTASFPSSFYRGPAGTNNLLPPNEGYPSRGAWIGEASGNGLTQVHSREQYIGRKFNIYSYYAQNRCDPWPATLASVAAAGYIPMISWYPTPDHADQIINGKADRCIKAFGNAIANQSARVLIRPYWEFNGDWQPFSKNANGTRATAAEEKQMWQHTIDVLRTTNAFSKASIVWSVSEGYYNNGDAWNNPTPYPGDKYVDWVASGGYNHDSSSAWCGLHAGWCSFAEALTHGYYAPKYNPRGVERDFRGRKPYLVGETGSAEDPNTAGRKGQWMVDMGNYAKNHMPDLYAIVYFDKTYDGINWSLNTSTSSMNGFKRFANDTYFKVPTLSSTGSAGSPGGSRHQRFFRSPSRTISCEIHVGKRLGTEAYCQTLRPPKNAVVHAGGHVTKCFGSRCLRNPPEHTLTLGYGRKVTLRPFRCTSLRKGMRCTVIRSGHGFLIKRSGIRRF